MGLFHHVLIYMVDLHLFLPVLPEHGGLLHVLPLTVHLIFFGWTSRWDHSKMFLLFEFCCGTPPSCIKVGGWWVGGLEQFSVSPRIGQTILTYLDSKNLSVAQSIF